MNQEPIGQTPEEQEEQGKQAYAPTWAPPPNAGATEARTHAWVDGDPPQGLGLALGGGGSKGAFEIGAWKAFRELGLRFDMVAGTSIGAINGGFVAMDAFEAAEEMWDNLRLDQCLAFDAPYPLKSSDLLNLKNMRTLAREMVTRHRLNTQPLRELIARYLPEDRIRKGPIRYGLMTVLMRSLTPQPRWIEEIPEHRLLDYIMASAGLPGLAPVEIEGRRFLDGGFAEVLPLSMLRAQGCRRIVAVELSPKAQLRGPVIDNLQLTLVHDPEDLGGMFDLRPATLARNRRLGYLDAMKAFGRLQGERYTFDNAAYRALLARFGHEHLAGLEQAAAAYDMDRLPIHTAETFLDTLQACRQEAQAAYEAKREALKIEEKTEAVWSGRLPSLKMLPPMRLSFLLELTAKARTAGNRFHIPTQLFRNLELAADALRALDEED